MTEEWERYHLECPSSCSLAKGLPGSARASDMLFEKRSLRSVQHELARINVKTSVSTLQRHSKHIIPSAPPADESLPDEEAPDRPQRAKVTNVEILETIIQKGFANSRNWKPTIADTMKAMDMWFKLTQASPFDDLLKTLAAAATEADEPAESEEAALEAGERPDAVA